MAVPRRIEQPLSKRIAVLLRDEMSVRGVTQSELARMVGCSQTTVSRHVRTGRGLPVDTLNMYCLALGLDTADVVARANT